MSTDDHGPREGDTPPVAPPTRGGGALMFWVLLALAATGFVPCIVLPVWRDYQTMALAVQAEERIVATMQAGVERQQRTLAAIRTDPAVGARLAQRELTYRRPGQDEFPVPGVPVVRPVATAQPLDPIEPPAAVARLIERLPTANYDQVFCRNPSRTALLLLSGGLMVAAFVLYPPGRRPAGQAAATD